MGTAKPTLRQALALAVVFTSAGACDLTQTTVRRLGAAEMGGSECRADPLKVAPGDLRPELGYADLPARNAAVLTRKARARAMFPKVDGSGVTIAIVDTGIDFAQPEFALKSKRGWDCTLDPCTANPAPDRADTSFAWQHGTAVAGFAAADSPRLQGVAPKADLISFRVRFADPPTYARALKKILALNNAAGATGKRISVVNMSLGDWGQALAERIALRDSGVVLVYAGGNSRSAVDPKIYHRSPPSTGYMVGGSTYADLANVVPFDRDFGMSSATGPGLALYAPGASQQRLLFASLLTTGTGPGTSWAAPQVAGAAALLKQIKPALAPAQIIEWLRGDPAERADRVVESGVPMLDVLYGVTKACEATPGSPLCPIAAPQPPLRVSPPATGGDSVADPIREPIGPSLPNRAPIGPSLPNPPTAPPDGDEVNSPPGC